MRPTVSVASPSAERSHPAVVRTDHGEVARRALEQRRVPVGAGRRVAVDEQQRRSRRRAACQAISRHKIEYCPSSTSSASSSTRTASGATRSASSSTATQVPEAERQRRRRRARLQRDGLRRGPRERPDPDLHPRPGAALRRPPDGRHRLAAGRDRHAGRRRCRPAAGEVAVRAEGADDLRRRPARVGLRPRLHASSARPPRCGRWTARPRGSEASYAWAWIDEDAGTLRARCFVEEAGIAEDEATGAAAIVLGGALEPAGDDPPGPGLGARSSTRSATAGSRSAAACASTRCAITAV